MSDSLTIVETAKLENYETMIEGGLKSFVDTGRALMAIRDERLYRIGHSSFESYCEERWGFTKRRANQLITASEIVKEVGNKFPGSYPSSDTHVAPLGKLPLEEQADAWQEAVETAPEGKVTANHVKEVVERRKEAKADKPKPTKKPPKGQAILDVAGAFDEQCRQIDAVCHWARTVSDDPAGSMILVGEVIAALDEAKKQLRAAKPTALCKKCSGKGCDDCGALGVLFGPKKTSAA